MQRKNRKNCSNFLIKRIKFYILDLHAVTEGLWRRLQSLLRITVEIRDVYC